MPKAKKATAVMSVVDPNTETLIRRLSSITERLEKLKALDKKVRETLFAIVEAAEGKTLNTLYGTLTIREKKEYNFEKCKKVIEARKAFEEAKARLEAAEEAAKADAPYEKKESLAFNRNKAVSARAKRGRVYIRSFFSRLKSRPEIPS